MKNLLLLAVVALFAASCGTKTAPKEEEKPSYTLKTDKAEYTVGETIKVEFTADATWDKNAWVGIITSKK